MKSNKRGFLIPIFIITIISLVSLSVVEYTYIQTLENRPNGIYITGSIRIIQNHQTVRYIPDAIQALGGVDTIMCYLFNFTGSCNNVTNYYGSATNQLGTACQYWKGGTPTLTTGFFSNSLCSMQGIALSTDNSAVSTGTVCPLIQTANGLAPAKGSEILIPLPAGIQLTASYTPTSVVTLNKLCLVAWNVHSNTFAVSNTGTLNGNNAANTFAIDAISPAYTTAIGTPFTVQWTISIGYS